MFRLPRERLDVAIAEPSQRLCPHWALTVVHQALREVLYWIIGTVRFVYRLFAAVPSPPRMLGKVSEATPIRAAGQKRVLFIRHGQGAHNATIKNWGVVDPELNAEGEAQVAALNKQMQPFVRDIELVACSPLTRALQTATGGLAGNRAQWCVLPLLRERLGAPCDTGRTRAELLRCFPEMAGWEGVDELREVWWATSTELDLFERIDALCEWLHERDETCIAVVGHGGLFARILGHHLKNCGYEWVDWSSKSAASDVYSDGTRS